MYFLKESDDLQVPYQLVTGESVLFLGNNYKTSYYSMFCLYPAISLPISVLPETLKKITAHIIGDTKNVESRGNILAKKVD